MFKNAMLDFDKAQTDYLVARQRYFAAIEADGTAVQRVREELLAQLKAKGWFADTYVGEVYATIQFRKYLKQWNSYHYKEGDHRMELHAAVRAPTEIDGLRTFLDILKDYAQNETTDVI